MSDSVMPTLLPDRSGYELDGVIVDGFADRLDLTDAQRARIARWSRRFADGDAAEAPEAADGAPLAMDPLAAGLIADRQELQELHVSGLLDQLDEKERRWLAYPETHPDLGALRYPLSVGVLATLADCSEDQVRHWADAGVVPSFRVGVERRFGRSGAARAMLLARAPNPEKAILSSVAAGEGRRMMLLLAAVTEDVLSRQQSLSADERRAIGDAMRLAANHLAPRTPSRPASKPKKRTLHVVHHKGQWLVTTPKNQRIGAGSKQAEALEIARATLREDGGGELQVFGRKNVRKYAVAARHASRPTRAKSKPRS